MVRENTNGMTRRRVNGLRFGTSLIAILGIVGLLSASAAAAEQVAADPCDSALVNEKEAKRIASSFMQDLGYTRSDTIAGTRFRIREANCVNGQWRVRASLSAGFSPDRETVVLVNCHSGEIEETLRSA